MYDLGLAKAGLLRIPARPELVYDFLPVAARTIQHYGVEVNGLRYNGSVLDAYRNTESPYGGTLDGKWPVRFDPDDVRWVYFQDPADNAWHALEWEHAPGLAAPFSAEAARHARRLAATEGGDRWPDEAQALTALLARWQAGTVTDRRERHLALRLAAERAALPAPQATSDAASDAARVQALPSVAALNAAQPRSGSTPTARLRLVGGAAGGEEPGEGQPGGQGGGLGEAEPYLAGDDDDAEEVFHTADGVAGADADFYADAFEVLE
jgi:hypothetical protein